MFWWMRQPFVNSNFVMWNIYVIILEQSVHDKVWKYFFQNFCRFWCVWKYLIDAIYDSTTCFIWCALISTFCCAMIFLIFRWLMLLMCCLFVNKLVVWDILWLEGCIWIQWITSVIAIYLLLWLMLQYTHPQRNIGKPSFEVWMFTKSVSGFVLL